MEKCAFCKQPIEGGLKVESKGHEYCCSGCATADRMLKGDDQGGPSAKLVQKYAHLSAATETEGLIHYNAEHATWDVQLPAIHCTSCLILLERMGEWLPGVHAVRVFFSAKRATITFNPSELSISWLAAWLDYVGYPPSMIPPQKQQRKQIAQLGIAGFAMGNAMMSAFPEYFGLTEEGHNELLIFFRYSTALFATLSLLIAGRGYVENAYKAVRSTQWSLDIPIAIGMLALWFWSAYLLLSGASGGYFDSLSGLIFFLLLGKWLQERTYAAFSFERSVHDFLPISVFSLDQNKHVRLGDLPLGARIQIPSDTIIPVKCELTAPAELDYSYITGESDIQPLPTGAVVQPGGRNAGDTLYATVLELPSQRGVEQLWKGEDRLNTGWVSERVTAIFTIAVLVLSVGGAIVWYQLDPTRALEIAVSVLIIACPCALSLAAPFAYGTASARMSKSGLYLKSGIGVEKLAQAKHFFWDKTGTLTHQRNAGTLSDLDPSDQRLLLAMVQPSTHPIAQAIASQLKVEKPASVQSWKEHVGQGLEAENQAGQCYKLGSGTWLGLPLGPTYFVRENEVLASFEPALSYRPGMEEIFEELTAYGATHHLLSGDQPKTLPDEWLPYLEQRISFNQRPEQKAEVVANYAHTLFMGDGLNDVAAMEEASLGLAVVEGHLGYFPKSGGVLQAVGLRNLGSWMRYARRVKTWVKLAYFISLSYNIAGLAYALSGALSPVVAAILMPLSSITVVLFSVLGARFLEPKS